MSAITQLDSPNGGIDTRIRMAAVEVIVAARSAGYTVPATSWFNPASTPEHHIPGLAGDKGCAVDFMSYQDTALGNWVADYLWEHRARLGLCWIIWRDRIRSTSAGKSGNWEARGKGDHFDHVHANFGRLIGNNGYTRLPVVTYKPLIPWIWDGASFPGAERFFVGATGPWVTYLGQRLVAHGWTGYSVGPGPEFTAIDKAGVTWFQQKQGWTGSDADGIPGPETWRRLAADPVKPTVPEVPPTPEQPKPPTDTGQNVTYTETIGGGNILRETDPDKTRKRWPDRKANVVKALKATGGTVLLICEADKSTSADVAAGLGSGWAYYPSGFKTGKEFSPLCVLWDTTVWNRVDGEFVQEFSDNENRLLLRVPLVHTRSGRKVWFYVSHLENDGDPATDGHAARRTETRDWAKWTLDGPGVFYADLNSTTPPSADTTEREREKPRPILKAAGWSTFLSSKRASIPNGKYASHHGGHSSLPVGAWIDEMGAKGVRYVKGALVRTDQTDASDHHFLSMTVTL